MLWQDINLSLQVVEDLIPYFWSINIKENLQLEYLSLFISANIEAMEPWFYQKKASEALNQSYSKLWLYITHKHTNNKIKN